MRASRRPQRTTATSRRTLVLFALAVILPGLLLTALGIVTVRQDRSLADQQLRERRDVLADRAAASLETELRGWQAALAALPLDSSPDTAGFPPLIRTALERSDLAVCVTRGPSGTRAWPARRLLYDVDGPARSRTTSGLFRPRWLRLSASSWSSATSFERPLPTGHS